MALASTTLAAACGALDNLIVVTSATGFAAGSYCRVDAELMKIQAVSGTNISVFRGIRGTQAIAHTIYSNVAVGTSAEFAAVASNIAVPTLAVQPNIYTYAVAGAISLLPGTHRIGASAAEIKAMTLAAPSVAEDGLELTIVGDSEYAHTVTATAGFYNDTTSSDVATFAAKKGASFTVFASGGKWMVKAAANVTFA